MVHPDQQLGRGRGCCPPSPRRAPLSEGAAPCVLRNYAPTILVQDEAVRAGCQQALWLYGDDHQITEVGTMNIFLFWTDPQGDLELVTPPLNGIILPGVTRRSLLDLGRKWYGRVPSDWVLPV
nr:branched-chain-amino-acid aminotransferase, mitochondrial-like [Chrysemys picta bellii]